MPRPDRHHSRDSAGVDRRKVLCAIAALPARLAGQPGGTGHGRPESNAALSLAYRVPPARWRTTAQFGRLLALLQAHRSAVDEVVLFDEVAFWPPLEELRRNGEILRSRLGQLRAAGFARAGVNVLYTLGHRDVPGPSLPALPFRPAVGHDGLVSTSCPCPNGPDYRAYIREKYAIVARSGPDFVWVDDDLRMSHHGPVYPCFCAICLEKFGQGTNRVALVEALNAPENAALRRTWTEFEAASLESLCADIRRAISAVNPSLEVGLMTIGYSHSTWAGYPIRRWMKAMGARRGRPGHGYYTDQVPRELLNKAFDVGRQVRDYPPEVKTIQYELENYPYIALDKATRTVLNECTAALIMGCNGVAFNLFSSAEGSLEDYRPILDRVVSERATWDALVKHGRELPLVGFWPADHRLLMANREVDGSGWFWEHGVYDIQRPNQTAEMGLPLTTDPHSACGVLLAGKVAEAFSADELKQMLSRAVLMDGFALDVLWSRGLGALTGVRSGEKFPAGVAERLSNHPLNRSYAGDGRDALIGPQDRVCNLIPVAPGVGDLAYLSRPDGTQAGSCFSVYGNALGGRVAVSTYAPWWRLGGSAIRHRLLAVADWLTRGRLPLLIEQTVRVAPLLRISPDGRRLALVLLNSALDESGPLTLRLRARAREVSMISPEKLRPLRADREGDGLVVHVPSIPAWQTAILVGR